MKVLLQLASLASLALVSSVSAVEFTYFGTNNDSFEPFLETSLPISIEGDAIPQADQGSNLYQNGTILVTQFVDQDLSGLSTFGKSKVTITQTTQLAGYILKVRYFKQDANNNAGFSASGPVLQIDGDELVSADVTAQAETGGGISEQTGFQLRAWKEAKTTGGGDDAGGNDGGDSGDSSTSSVMNPSGLAQTGANLVLTVEADLDRDTWESFYTPDGGVKTLVGSGTGVTEIDHFYFNIKSDPNDLWGDSLLIPPGETPSAGDNITVGYILLGETKSWGIEPVLAIGFNDDSGTSMVDAAVLLDTAQDSRFNYKQVNQFPNLIYPTPNGWDYGGPVTHNGSLNLGYTQYFRWTNSGNGGLADVTKRYGLDSSTPNYTYENENGFITSGSGSNFQFPSTGKISLEIFISSYDLSRSWDNTREDDSASLPGKGIQFGLANGYEAGAPQAQKAYIDLLTLETVTDDISIPEGSIGFKYIGTHNDSFENFVIIPTITTTSDIPLHLYNSTPNLSETFTVAEFANQDLSSFSQFGRAKITIRQTSELAGHNLKVRFYRQNSASADNWTPSGPTLSIDGDTLASGEVTAQAESGIGVNNQTGFLVKVWKEAKETEPLVIPDGHIAFTFIGTNNHDFSAFVTVPTTLDAATIPAQPQESLIYAEGSLLVAGWTGDPVGGAGFGKVKVTIPQTSLLENYDLKVRFFKADASNESGFSAAGTVISINGDSLSAGEVTAEAASDIQVSEQTGFQVKIWKESRIDTDFDDDGVDDSNDAFPTDPNETVDADGNGRGDNADATAAVALPVLNISVVGTDVILSWDDTRKFDLYYSNDLSVWTNTDINTSPYSTTGLNVNEFYKLVEPAPEPDTSAPIITLNGGSTINLLLGEPYYVERGATAFDEIDGKVGVDVSGVVYTSRPQDSPFTITYTATDADGNTSTATRTVNIIEPNWSQLGDDTDGEAEQDGSGIVSLSSDGTRLAIGAPANDGTDQNSGHVRVYEWSGNTWIQMGQDIDGEARRDTSGSSVSLSGDGMRVAIGAPENSKSLEDWGSGHVRVYEWSGNTWTQMGQDIDGEAEQDGSGGSGSVSLSSDGTRVAIGARRNDGGGFNSGHVRVYEWDNGTWTQIGQDIDGEKADIYAGVVSLSGDGTRVAIGAAGSIMLHTTGQVRIYDLINDTWTQTGQVIHGEDSGDKSGGSVSLSSDGMRVAIGARGNDGEDGNPIIGTTVNVGHVRVYEWSNETWTQRGVVIQGKWTQIGQDIDGEVKGDSSGDWGSVSLSSDGTRLAIGARGNDGGGNESGHVRVYEWYKGTWTQLKLDIDGEAAEDSSGVVSLSGDGTRVAIGAPANDGDDQSNAVNEPGENYGHVRVYKLPEEIKIKESDLFTISPNSSWPNVISLTEIANGASSQLEQKLMINVVELPVGGANYRILRNGPNGRWIFTTGALSLGVNVITVPPDTFNRAVRVQFSTGTVKFNTLAVQSVLSNGYVLRGNRLFPRD